jgi:isocitrate dehydrogenase
MAEQNDDAELKTAFAPLAKSLSDYEAKIVGELNAVQGKPVDIGGYYAPSPELAAKAMRPSATFNTALESFSEKRGSQARG